MSNTETSGRKRKQTDLNDEALLAVTIRLTDLVTDLLQPTKLNRLKLQDLSEAINVPQSSFSKVLTLAKELKNDMSQRDTIGKKYPVSEQLIVDYEAALQERKEELERKRHTAKGFIFSLRDYHYTYIYRHLRPDKIWNQEEILRPQSPNDDFAFVGEENTYVIHTYYDDLIQGLSAMSMYPKNTSKSNVTGIDIYFNQSHLERKDGTSNVRVGMVISNKSDNYVPIILTEQALNESQRFVYLHEFFRKPFAFSHPMTHQFPLDYEIDEKDDYENIRYFLEEATLYYNTKKKGQRQWKKCRFLFEDHPIENRKIHVYGYLLFENDPEDEAIHVNKIVYLPYLLFFRWSHKRLTIVGTRNPYSINAGATDSKFDDFMIIFEIPHNLRDVVNAAAPIDQIAGLGAANDWDGKPYTSLHILSLNKELDTPTLNRYFDRYQKDDSLDNIFVEPSTLQEPNHGTST